MALQSNSSVAVARWKKWMDFRWNIVTLEAIATAAQPASSAQHTSACGEAKLCMTLQLMHWRCWRCCCCCGCFSLICNQTMSVIVLKCNQSVWSTSWLNSPHSLSLSLHLSVSPTYVSVSMYCAVQVHLGYCFTYSSVLKLHTQNQWEERISKQLRSMSFPYKYMHACIHGTAVLDSVRME